MRGYNNQNNIYLVYFVIDLAYISTVNDSPC